MSTKSVKKKEEPQETHPMDSKPVSRVLKHDEKMRDALSYFTDGLIAAMEQVSDAVLIVNEKGVVEYVNPVFESISGYLGSETDKKSLADFFPAIFQNEEFEKDITKSLDTDNTWHGKTLFVRKDKTQATRRVTIKAIRNPEGAICQLVAVLQHEPESDPSVEVIHEVCGLDRIGRLTSGVAHDINNHLSVIINYTYVLTRHLKNDPNMAAHVHEVQKAAWRASRLSQQLLIFGRRNIDEPQILDINVAIRELSKLLCHLLGDSIQIELELAPDLWPVNMALAQIEQLLINLVIRRRDAMAGQGLLTIQTENVDIKESQSQEPEDAKPGSYIKLSINDSGPLDKTTDKSGVDEDSSFKELSNTYGLGYSMIIRTIRQVGGYLHIMSQEKGLTSFVVYLPMASDESGDFMAPPGSILQFD